MGNYTGSTITTNCIGNEGCAILNNNGNSFGAGINSVGGGLFAMEWTSWGISMWFWNEGSIPEDAKSNTPNTANWGNMYASWQFGDWCPSSHFSNQQIVFDL